MSPVDNQGTGDNRDRGHEGRERCMWSGTNQEAKGGRETKVHS